VLVQKVSAKGSNIPLNYGSTKATSELYTGDFAGTWYCSRTYTYTVSDEKAKRTLDMFSYGILLHGADNKERRLVSMTATKLASS
jgi:hypothetical protein